IPALPLFSSIAADLLAARVRGRAISQPDGGGGARDFFHRDAVLEIAQSRPAPFLLDRDAVHAELAQIGPKIARKDVAAVDLVGAWRDAISGKPAHAIAQHVGGLAQAEVKTANVIHAHVGRSRRMTAVPDRNRSS